MPTKKQAPKKPKQDRVSSWLVRHAASWERVITTARRKGDSSDIHERLDAEIPYRNRYEKRGVPFEEFSAMYRAGVEMALGRGSETNFLRFMDEAFCYVEWMMLSSAESRAVCGWMLDHDPHGWFEEDFAIAEVL